MIVVLKIPSKEKSYEINLDTLSYSEIEHMENELDITWGELSLGL